MSAAELVWTPSPDFPEGRAYDTEHEGTTWRIALVLHDEPVGMSWIDEEAADGWRLYKADGGRMQPIASPLRGLDYVQSHAALRICPRRVHR